MNRLSENLVNAITAEKRREATRLAESKRHAESKTDQPKKRFWQSLKDFVRNLLSRPYLPDEVVHSEENLYHAEMLGMSPEELLRQEAKRRMYERIARGNALVEAENVSQKMWEGRL